MRRLLVLLLAVAVAVSCLPTTLLRPSSSSISPTLSPSAAPRPSATTLPSAVPPTETPPHTPATYTGLHLERLGASYQAIFELRFEGDFVWTYHLETRTDDGVVEHYLHLEGLSAAVNPGDVRVVIEDETVRMRGPGTDDECFQFPGDPALGLAFLTPDDIVDPEQLAQPLLPVAADIIAGAEVIHYAVRLATFDGWQDVELDIWRDSSAGAVLRYDLRASGPDPFFEAGEGTLTGEFLVHEIGRQTIKPIEGCEIDVPLPADAARLAKLPGGLVVFESLASPSELADFYQDRLPEAGWEPLADPQISGDGILLNYRRGVQTLEISLGPGEEGAHVELLLGGE